MTLFLIALGGALGSVMRYLLGLIVSFPFGTLMVNVGGSFLMGIAFSYFSTRINSMSGLFVMTGILGGFTTFSAFSLDVYKLYDSGRILFASSYVLGSVILSLGALYIGLICMRIVHL